MLRRLPRWAAELLSANFSASLLALPLSLFFFQRYAFSGFFSGLLLAPLAAAITVCGALLLFLVFLPCNAVALALLPAGVFLALFFKVSDWFYEHLSLSIFRPVAAAGGCWPSSALLFYAVSLARLKGATAGGAGPAPGGAPLLHLFPGCALPSRAAGSLFSRRRPRRRGRSRSFPAATPCSSTAAAPASPISRPAGAWSCPSCCKRRSTCAGSRPPTTTPTTPGAGRDHRHSPARGIVALLRGGDDVYYRRLLAARPEKTTIRKIGRGFVKEIAGCSVACLSPPSFIDAALPRTTTPWSCASPTAVHAFLFAGDIERDVEAELVIDLRPGLAQLVS